MIGVAVGDQGRARVLYRIPEQRRVGVGGMPSMLASVLLALVLFLGGLLVGRAITSRGTAAPPAAAPATTAPAQAPGATTPATAATTPQAQAGEAAATSRVGPRAIVKGVPVGYQHSEQGAVAASANYARVLSSAMILDQARRRAAIQAISAPEALARQQRAFDQAVALLSKGLGVGQAGARDGTVLLRAVPVGWRLEAYTGDRARVAIWVTSVLGALSGPQGVPVREAWGTTTVDLRWVDGDWKLLNTTTTDGPVPIADTATPTAASQLIPEAQDFKEFTYAPGS
ncbi:MAG TPA: hypothetical protein VGR74_23330 [Actinomycetota bacterium]|jgi:hypothetical protein|nr:hypothetical protein [Actinomycetota bacterium]